jgi:hypothetical protein
MNIYIENDLGCRGDAWWQPATGRERMYRAQTYPRQLQKACFNDGASNMLSSRNHKRASANAGFTFAGTTSLAEYSLPGRCAGEPLAPSLCAGTEMAS